MRGPSSRAGLRSMATVTGIFTRQRFKVVSRRPYNPETDANLPRLEPPAELPGDESGGMWIAHGDGTRSNRDVYRNHKALSASNGT
jgi:hypothetical protein